jgi:pimeloyl-ACP methyl ester carboxylesterase
MQLEVISRTENVTRPSPILFVHGAWHAAWCWENFLPYFSERGYAAYALSLRGHGGSAGRQKLRWLSAAHGYVEDIQQVVQTLPSPPVIVAHSLGGYVLQKYLERHTAPAAVLMASVPPSGILGFGLRYAVRHPWQFLKAHLLLNPWYFVETPALAHELFFSEKTPGNELARHFSRLQPESFRAELDAMALSLPRPGRVTTPILVLGAADDRAFTVAEQHATARAYHTEAHIFPGMPHDLMLGTGWQGVADQILAWLKTRGL